MGTTASTETSRFSISSFLVVGPEIREGNGSNAGTRLLFSTRTGALVGLAEPAWRRLQDGQFSALPARWIAELAQTEILIPPTSPSVEREQVAAQRRSMRSASQTLYRMVFVSHECPLDCVYCSQEHESKHLTDASQEWLVADIKARLSTGSYRDVSIAWFGGEPLTAKNRIYWASDQLHQVCESNDALYRAKVVSNGLLLTPEVARELKGRCSVSEIIISVDGTPDTHDARRPRKGGAGSYSRIAQNLETIARCDPQQVPATVIRVNLDESNFGSASEIVDWIGALRDTGLDLSVQLAPVIDWGSHRTSISREEYAAAEVDLLVALVEAGISVPLLPQPRHSACLTQEPDSFVLTSDGLVENCAMTPLVPGAETPATRRLGSTSGPGSIIAGASTAQLKPPIDQLHPECAKCNFYFMCYGHCPKELDEGKLPCPSFRANMESRITLEFLRSRFDFGDRQSLTVNHPHPR